MTLEQERALALARARKRKAEAEGAVSGSQAMPAANQPIPQASAAPQQPVDIMGANVNQMEGQASAQPASPRLHASREAALDKRMELRQVENLKRKADRADNTTTAGDAFVGQAAQWGTQGLWDGIRASYDVAGEEGGLMKSTRDMVPVFGALPYVSDKVRAGLAGDQARKDDLEAREDMHEVM